MYKIFNLVLLIKVCFCSLLFFEKGEKMNRIIYILLTIIFFQLLGIGYMKFIDKKGVVPTQPPPKIEKKIPLGLETCSNSELKILVNDSIKEILKGSKNLPQSTEYTVWDKKTVEHLSQNILKSTKHQVDRLKNSLKSETFSQRVQSTKVPNKTVLKPLVPNLAKNSIEHLTQKIIKESKINTITIVKKEEKKKQIKKSKAKKTKIAKKKVIKKPKTITITQKLEKYAKAKLGQKYVWGATGPNRFDCSGFTKYVFHSTAGIKIPRVSRDQAKVGKYIKNLKDLRRGDMVFFDTEKKFTGRVNHVGIYLSNGNFIHASSARKKVIITNFRKKPFYKRRFLWGRRIINNS